MLLLESLLGHYAADGNALISIAWHWHNLDLQVSA